MKGSKFVLGLGWCLELAMEAGGMRRVEMVVRNLSRYMLVYTLIAILAGILVSYKYSAKCCQEVTKKRYLEIDI